jgi:hypothetical protein
MKASLATIKLLDLRNPHREPMSSVLNIIDSAFTKFILTINEFHPIARKVDGTNLDNEYGEDKLENGFSLRLRRVIMRENNQQPSTILSLMTLVIAIDAVAVFGAAVSQQVIQKNVSWLLMAALVVILHSTGLKRVLGERLMRAVGDLAALSTAFLFDPSIAVILAAINIVMVSGNLKDGYRKPLFKVSSAAVSMNAAVYAAIAVFPSFGDRTIAMSASEIISATAFSAAVYLALSTALLAAYEAIGNRGSFFEAMKESFSANFDYIDSRQHKKLRLGEVLIAHGLITDSDLSRALETQKKSVQPSKRVGEILVEMGLVEERHVMAALTECFTPAYASM